jgi:hypothetical protein
VPPLVEQLEALLVRLRRRHPDLLGLGLGQRTRRGRIVPESVIKLQVKVKRRRPARPFPRHVRLAAVVLGQAVGVSVPTDVETVPRVHATRLSVDGMRASALASWTGADGARRGGVITAAHGLPRPDDPDPTVPVELADGTQAAGTVVARSDLAADGWDVGLVRVDGPLARLADIAPSRPPLATADELLALLSASPADPTTVRGETWSGGPSALRALAFLLEWEWQGVPGKLRRVVQARAQAALVFQPGTSGSCWVATPAAGARAMAVQSHAIPPKFRDAFGTHLLSAVEWLRAQPGLASLQVAWREADLP